MCSGEGGWGVEFHLLRAFFFTRAMDDGDLREQVDGV